MFAQPHEEHSTGGEGNHDHDGSPDPFVGQQAVAADQGVIPEALQQANGQGRIPGNGLDLLLALFPAVLGQPLQGRNGNGQQLDDDGGVDVGLDGQGEQGRLGQSRAAQGVEQAKDRPGVCRNIILEILGVDIRHRDRRADAEDQQREDDEQELAAQLRQFPRVADGLKH